jgi:hypothetical protein
MEDDGDVSGHRFRGTVNQVGGDGSARDAGSSGVTDGTTSTTVVTRSGKLVCVALMILYLYCCFC